MPELRLQDYVTKIKNLIESDRADEAIAHCQHILRHHTKHIETYCLLGEACLEKGAWREAIEFFQRTLSADPENFIARVGLGVIYSEQGALPGAIWQMERAFELAPGNTEVRHQLQALYDQRDGGEKARLRLTPGALGRLYSRNGLYERAIGEFRAILDQDPDLPDVQIALAEALWLEGRRLEAVETCLDLVDALPHCLKANLILGEVWTKGEHEEAGEERLQIAQSLDPENRVAQEMMGEESPLPPREVLIPKLEVSPGALVPVVVETPAEAELAWLEGKERAEEEEEPGEISEWAEEAFATLGEGLAPEEEAFATPGEGLAPEEEAMQPPLEEEPPSEEETPAWLSQLMGEIPPSPAKAEETLLEEEGLLETVVPGGHEPTVDEPAREEAPALPPGEEVSDTVSDLEAMIGIAEEELVPPGEEVPDSLRALVEAGILNESDLATAMAEMSEEDVAAQQAEEVPQWLRDLIGEEVVAQSPAVAATAEILEEEVIVPPVEESALAPEAVPEGEDLEEVPEWLKELGVPPAEPLTAVEPPPDVAEEGAVPEEAVSKEEEVEEPPEEILPLEADAEVLPGWLKEMGMPDAEPATVIGEKEADLEEAISEKEVPPEADVEELPAWLKDLEAPPAEPPGAGEEEIAPPLEQVEEPAAEAPSRVSAAGIEEEPTVSPQEDVPESLRALVEAGILDESDVALAMAQMSAEDLAAQHAEEVPEWLRDLAGEELGPEIAPAPEEEAVSPLQAGEVPAWLRDAVVTPEEEAPAPAEVEPEVEAPALEETILELPAAAEEPEETVEVAEEALALEEMALEPSAVEVVEEPSTPVMEAAAPEIEAAPSADKEMVAPYDRVEVEEDIPVRRRIDDLEQRLEANPRDFPLRLELARLYREERDWDAALKHYQKLISARMFLPAILDDLELMLKREVEPAHIYQLMGDAYMQENALDKALEMYRLAQHALTKR